MPFSGYFAAPLTARHHRTAALRHKLACPPLFSLWLWAIYFSSVIYVLHVKVQKKEIHFMFFFFYCLNFAEAIAELRM